MGWHY